ncbi:hypothetical protein [Ligilactobacillus faecis]|uniref:hypothetical protein n=1 Tax=Ligilactobacillus faecis TaxID=762833 RepID=UPI002469817E|nr:hypothetical protein [Ligilactobacillus faecis]WGN89156.1 hypothetical protein QFX10_08920 [Ligilactobacillus faecis]
MLIFSEYQELGGQVRDEDVYIKLERDALKLLNTATQMFYIRNNIDEDPDQWRVKMFKLALVAQIDYTNDVGASTEYEYRRKLLRACPLGCYVCVQSEAVYGHFKKR